MLKRIMIPTMLAVMTLTGCQTTRTNAMTGEVETSGAATGTILGCIGGAVAGAALGDGKGAAIGCVAGGGIGLLAGNNLDEQESALRKELLNSGVQIKRNGEQIDLILNGDISFQTGSSALSSQIKPSLRSIAKIMNRYDDTKLLISGHTDSVGKASFNKQLSEYRAQAVQAYLNRSGLARSRTYAEGYGETMPVCSNRDKLGRACNRRVELTIIPKS